MGRNLECTGEHEAEERQVHKLPEEDSGAQRGGGGSDVRSGLVQLRHPPNKFVVQGLGFRVWGLGLRV